MPTELNRELSDAEINARIAEKVMGCRLCETKCCWLSCANSERLFDAVGPDSFDPLTNAEHSRQVRAKLAEMGHDVALFSYRQWKLRGYDAEFRCSAPSPKTFAGNEAWADTEEMAVALAALKSVE